MFTLEHYVHSKNIPDLPWTYTALKRTVQAERYLVEDDRALFMFRDGSAAWEAKEWLKPVLMSTQLD